MRLAVLLLALTLVPSVVRGQDHVHGPFCGTDLDSDATRDALRAFADAREAGLLPVARKALDPPQIGDVRTFNVSESSWQARDFELIDATDVYYLWVEQELWQTLSPERRDVIGTLNGAMGSSTPPGSYRPDRGIVANNVELFGPIPNVDGDGMLDILMYDIKDGDTDGSRVLGYVHPSDLSPVAGPGVGNQAEVLYLDANEGIGSPTTLAFVAAHELAHLIHFGFLGTRTELTFNMEGLAEYAMIVNGYTVRGSSYLLFASELGQPLFNWRGELKDYERASLFFGYLGDRIGPEATADIMEARLNGTKAVDGVLGTRGLNLREVIRDFHTANLLNDPGIAPAFGHLLPFRSNVRAALPAAIDGESANRSSEEFIALEGGAVRYLAWRNVRDFSLQFDAMQEEATDGTQFSIWRLRTWGRLVLERSTGELEWHDLRAPASLVVPGDFVRADLILTNAVGDVATAQQEKADARPVVSYTATWQALSTDTEPGAELPSEVTLDVNYPNPFNPSTVVPFSLPAAAPVRLALYDVLGRLVRTLDQGYRGAGRHEIRVDASGLPGGTYLVVLETPTARRTRTVTLLP